ncbi:MAG: hypothetical protein HOK67_26010 [Deltaproteobacteria bacterium]|nr:hypothetical protein [Deltaproteobacteria bacterium]
MKQGSVKNLTHFLSAVTIWRRLGVPSTSAKTMAMASSVIPAEEKMGGL